MPIKFGSGGIAGVYLGSTPIVAAYHGANQVFSTAAGTVEFIGVDTTGGSYSFSDPNEHPNRIICVVRSIVVADGGSGLWNNDDISIREESSSIVIPSYLVGYFDAVNSGYRVGMSVHARNLPGGTNFIATMLNATPSSVVTVLSIIPAGYVDMGAYGAPRSFDFGTDTLEPCSGAVSTHSNGLVIGAAHSAVGATGDWNWTGIGKIHQSNPAGSQVISIAMGTTDGSEIEVSAEASGSPGVSAMSLFSL